MTTKIDRRQFVACCSSLGIGSTLFPGALAAVAEDAETITVEMVEAAQKIAGLSFTPAQQEAIVERLNGERSPISGFEDIRTAQLGNDTPLALVFDPVPPGKPLPRGESSMRPSDVDVSMPSSDDELAFLPLTHLAKLVERQNHRVLEAGFRRGAGIARRHVDRFDVVRLGQFPGQRVFAPAAPDYQQLGHIPACSCLSAGSAGFP